MSTYALVILLRVQADNENEARELGDAAIEHLHNTFNDNDSIGYGEVSTALEVAE